MKNEKETTEVNGKGRKPDYTDSRRTNNGRGRVEIGVWENETENGVRFGTQLKYQYRPIDGDWKKLDNPLADQWIDVAKLLTDADTWKQDRLRERREAKANAEVEAEIEL